MAKDVLLIIDVRNIYRDTYTGQYNRIVTNYG